MPTSPALHLPARHWMLPVVLMLLALTPPTAAAVEAEDPCEQLQHAGWTQNFMWRTQELCKFRMMLTLARQQPAAPPAGAAPVPAPTPSSQELSPFPLPGPVSSHAPQGDSYRAETWVNMRSGPGVDHGVIARVLQDENLTPTGVRIGEWWQVVYRSPKTGQVTGWVFSQWVRRKGE